MRCVSLRSGYEGESNVTYNHVVQFVVISTPNHIRKVVVFANDWDVLICVVRETGLPEEGVTFNEILPPELDVDMFALLVLG